MYNHFCKPFYYIVIINTYVYIFFLFCFISISLYLCSNKKKNSLHRCYVRGLFFGDFFPITALMSRVLENSSNLVST